MREENFKTVENQCNQGELMVLRATKLPKGAKKATPEQGNYIVGHSETGHHHVISANQAEFYVTEDPFVCYLNVASESADLRHLRGFDTHTSVRIPKGIWEIRKQTEYTSEGEKMVQD